MPDVYEQIVEVLAAGRHLALATLVTRRGSAPGALGAKMLVLDDGTTAGSIGGGCVEAEVWDAARAALAGEGAQVLQFRLRSEDMAESGLICGGSVDILVRSVGPESLALFEGVVALRRGGSAGVLATPLPGADDDHAGVALGGDHEGAGLDGDVLLGAEGEVIASTFELPTDDGDAHPPAAGSRKTLDDIRAVAERLIPGELRVVAASGVVLESIVPPAHLYVFGAGHLSAALVTLAKRVHFQVTVIDDRAMFANVERFPDADEVIVSEFADAFADLDLGVSSYVVIVTRGHLHDLLVLERALATPATYIGMIGSRTKIAKIYTELEAGGVSPQRLAEVHAPIGLSIGARSPDEIAVSIVAELIQVRSGRLPRAKARKTVAG
jgi:xanthine dehydrogenase accessory factor